MDSSVSQKDQFWFLRVCLHVPIQLYLVSPDLVCVLGETPYGIYLFIYLVIYLFVFDVQSLLMAG
jgi:hypothetical protein